MKCTVVMVFMRTTLVLACATVVGGCSGQRGTEATSEAPPPASVEHEGDGGSIDVKHLEQFPLVTATAHEAVSELSVTGVVSPDVARAVPVVSLASGRVVDIRARLGDQVQKGQLLLRVHSADVSTAFSDSHPNA